MKQQQNLNPSNMRSTVITSRPESPIQKFIIGGGLFALIAGGWIFYTYQNEHKPIFTMESINGFVKGGAEDKQSFDINISFRKIGSVPSRKAEIYTSFLDWRTQNRQPTIVKIDETFTDYPDIVDDRTHAFTVEKFVPIKYFIDSTNFPGFMPLVMSVRWQAGSWIYWKREFIMTILFRVSPGMINENGNSRMVLNYHMVKGPTYDERWFWKREKPQDFLNNKVKFLMQDETINSFLDVDSFVNRGWKRN